MTSKEAVAQAQALVETARKHLVDYWAGTIDEDGTFSYTFGDPSSTPGSYSPFLLWYLLLGSGIYCNIGSVRMHTSAGLETPELFSTRPFSSSNCLPIPNLGLQTLTIAFFDLSCCDIVTIVCVFDAVAAHIIVGYGEDEEIQVDVVYPVHENNGLLVQSRGGTISVEGGMTDRELKMLQDVLYESADLLDTDVPKFAHIVYDFLHGLSPHASLEDPLYDEWMKLKNKATQLSTQFKQYVLPMVRACTSFHLLRTYIMAYIRY